MCTVSMCCTWGLQSFFSHFLTSNLTYQAWSLEALEALEHLWFCFLEAPKTTHFSKVSRSETCGLRKETSPVVDGWLILMLCFIDLFIMYWCKLMKSHMIWLSPLYQTWTPTWRRFSICSVFEEANCAGILTEMTWKSGELRTGYFARTEHLFSKIQDWRFFLFSLGSEIFITWRPQKTARWGKLKSQNSCNRQRVKKGESGPRKGKTW